MRWPFKHRCRALPFSYDGEDGRRYSDCRICCAPMVVNPPGKSSGELAAAARAAEASHPTYIRGKKQRFGPTIAAKIQAMVRGGRGTHVVKIRDKRRSG